MKTNENFCEKLKKFQKYSKCILYLSVHPKCCKWLSNRSCRPLLWPHGLYTILSTLLPLKPKEWINLLKCQSSRMPHNLQAPNSESTGGVSEDVVGFDKESTIWKTLLFSKDKKKTSSNFVEDNVSLFKKIQGFFIYISFLSFCLRNRWERGSR